MPINTPTLSVIDDADNTGGTATISNSTSGATNNVYAQRVNGELGTADWTLVGSIVGNGSIDVEVAVGFYWLKCVSISGGEQDVSNLSYIHFTDGDDAILEQCAVAIQARIQGLLLEEIPNSHVILMKVLSEAEKDLPETPNRYPLVLIVWWGAETERPGTVNRDDIGYPFLVMVIDADNQDQDKRRATYAMWRQQIFRAFRHSKLPGVNLVYEVVVEPQPIIDPGAWLQTGRFVSGFLFRCFSRERRGID